MNSKVDPRHTSTVRSILGACVPNHPKPSAKNTEGDFDRFTGFMRRLVAVPHSEIKAKLDAEKVAKKRTPKRSASRDSAVKP